MGQGSSQAHKADTRAKGHDHALGGLLWLGLHTDIESKGSCYGKHGSNDIAEGLNVGEIDCNGRRDITHGREARLCQ